MKKGLIAATIKTIRRLDFGRNWPEGEGAYADNRRKENGLLEALGSEGGKGRQDREDSLD